MPPLQTLIDEDLADPTPLDTDALLLIEVGAQAVERPAAERQFQALRVGQRGGDHLGPLLGGVGVRATRARQVAEAGEASVVEPMHPVVDRLSADPDLRSDGGRALPLGGGRKDPGALDEAGRFGPGVGEPFEGGLLLGAQGAEGELSGGRHG
jgi:hypothetical protein